MTGVIFDIKEFSVHDGPGGRVSIFLKGCPLRCIWCHNPEGLDPSPQLLHKKNLCTECKRCLVPCDHPECRKYGRCIHACINGALNVAGSEVSVTEICRKIMNYKEFFDISGGGVTFTGGEPLYQSEFVLEVCSNLPDIHKAIQTSGFAAHDIYRKAVAAVDFVMQDIKIADPEMHRKYTGVGNELILENIEYLKTSGKPFVFRVPLIPDITDTEENLQAISKIAGKHPVELLRYNVLAGAKYDYVGRQYPLGSEPNREKDYISFFQNARYG